MPCVSLVRVDGCRLLYGNWPATYPVLVDPGLRVLTVHGQHRQLLTREEGQVELKAALQAGHTYEILFERQERRMTFWMEDAVTHEAVSERQSTTATAVLDPGAMPAHF